uniref:Dihydrolipoamide acetyltransferase component of pyruvate dehydrogenase complex n=1 Tax=Biomphalaria glabrata TaxID=6526 RepID=A0A2C9M548_BIOGL
MPALSPTMKSGKIVEWLKKEGDFISSGEILFKVETDKAVMEVDSVDEGILEKIVFNAGSVVDVNSVIGVIVSKKEKKDGVILSDDSSYSATNVKNNNDDLNNANLNNAKSSINNVQNINSNNNNVGLKITPLARNIAKQNNLDINNMLNIDGTGPDGRIIKDDVLTFLSNKKTSGFKNEVNRAFDVDGNSQKIQNNNNITIVDPDNVRKVIASRLVQSKREAPHFYLTFDCMVDGLLFIREKINDNFAAKEQRVTVNDMIVMAVAHSIKTHPEINVSWQDDKIILYNNIDVSVAVSVGNNSLITPIVKNADKMSLGTISSEIKKLVKKAKENTLSLDEFQGGGFTVSNMGMFGIKEFKAIINPPQSAILAIGAIEKRPTVVDDEIKVAPFVVYIGEPKPGIHPLQNQSTWLSKERGGTIMPEIMDSLLKLYDISLRNKISFEELCLYAVKLGDGSENANNIKVNSNEKVIDVQAE